MVINVAIREGIRIATRYFPKTIASIQRADVRIHKSLYGRSGGRGVRHGRDIGAAAGGLYSEYFREDDIGTEFPQPENGPGFKPKARNKYQTRRGYKRRHKRCPSKYNRYN